jgi:hypothetical protein
VLRPACVLSYHCRLARCAEACDKTSTNRTAKTRGHGAAEAGSLYCLPLVNYPVETVCRPLAPFTLGRRPPPRRTAPCPGSLGCAATAASPMRRCGRQPSIEEARSAFSETKLAALAPLPWTRLCQLIHTYLFDCRPATRCILTAAMSQQKQPAPSQEPPSKLRPAGTRTRCVHTCRARTQ